MGIDRDHWLLNAFNPIVVDGTHPSIQVRLYYGVRGPDDASNWRVIIDQNGEVRKWSLGGLRGEIRGWRPVCKRFADLVRIAVEFHHGN